MFSQGLEEAPYLVALQSHCAAATFAILLALGEPLALLVLNQRPHDAVGQDGTDHERVGDLNRANHADSNICKQDKQNAAQPDQNLQNIEAIICQKDCSAATAAFLEIQ